MEVLALDRTLTASNQQRLARLVASQESAGGNTHDLANLIDSARLVPSGEVPPDVVTMYSQVLIAFPDGTQRKLVICWPEDAEPSEGFVSVLSPVGASVLGLRVGETARWQTPRGQDGTAQVVEMLFQPEASGDCSM